MLYIKSVFAGSSSGSWPVFYSSINVIDIAKRENIGSISMSSNDWEGIAYNYENNSIYIRDPKTKSIFRYDELAKVKLAVIPFDSESYARALETKSKRGLLARIREGFIDLLTSGSETERESITVNPITNKVYVSDNSLLWEIDG